MTTLRNFLAARPPQPNPPEYLSEAWCRELGRRFLRPARPRLVEALDLYHALGCDPLGGHERRARDAAAAWERALNDGLLPASWAGDAARCFVVEQIHGGNWPDHVRLVSTPRTAGDVVALASDVENVLRAEAVAAEWLARKAQFIHPRAGAGSPPDDGAEGTLWRVLPLDSRLPRTVASLEDPGLLPRLAGDWDALGRRASDLFLDGLADAFPRVAAQCRSLRNGGGTPPGGPQEFPLVLAGNALTCLNLALCWCEAARRRRALPRWWNWDALPSGARADELRDPFAPLLDVLWLGYLPEDSARRRAVLTAPDVIRYHHIEPRHDDR